MGDVIDVNFNNRSQIFMCRTVSSYMANHPAKVSIRKIGNLPLYQQSKCKVNYGIFLFIQCPEVITHRQSNGDRRLLTRIPLFIPGFFLLFSVVDLFERGSRFHLFLIAVPGLGKRPRCQVMQESSCRHLLTDSRLINIRRLISIARLLRLIERVNAKVTDPTGITILAVTWDEFCIHYYLLNYLCQTLI